MPRRVKAVVTGMACGVACAAAWLVVSIFPFIHAMVSGSGALGAVLISPLQILLAGLTGFVVGFYLVIRGEHERGAQASRGTGA